MIDDAFEKAKAVPDEIGDFIDDVMLPGLADGYRSSDDIARAIQEQEESHLEDFLESPNELDADKSMIWAWLAQEETIELVRSYVDRAFAVWGNENE